MKQIKWGLVHLLVCLMALALLTRSAGAQTASPNTNSDLLRQLYNLNLPTIVNQYDVTIGTSAAQLRPGDAARVELVVIDTGVSNCAFSGSATVSMSTGTVLGAGGGTAVENVRDDFTLPTLPTYAVCAATGGTLHVISIDLP